MTTYFQPMASGYFKVYSSETEHFWCCTGSGMESFTKLNDSIYYAAGNAVYVALYLSSRYETETIALTQTADLEHSDVATIRVDRGSAVLRLRGPAWTARFAVTVNGVPVTGEAEGGFVSVDVKAGDTVRVELEKTVTAHGLPDNANVYAFKYGPFVLSAQLGSETMNTGGDGRERHHPRRRRGNGAAGDRRSGAFRRGLHCGHQRLYAGERRRHVHPHGH